MQQLESKHKSELAAHFKSQEREMEQLWAVYDKELEKLKSKHKTESEQKVSPDCVVCVNSWSLDG